MKVVIPGGSGQVGQVLTRHFAGKDDEVVVLGRSGTTTEGTGATEPTTADSGIATTYPAHGIRFVRWDGQTLGDWADEIDGADVVINLAGRSVNCRYSEANKRAMMDSRVLSTRVVGEAIAKAARPPKVWLQASTATIYAHGFDAPNDEHTGIIGGQEPDVPAYWKFSIDIALAWEAELDAADTPGTRKVAMRSAMTMSVDKGGVFDVLLGLVRKGLGGHTGSGRQFVSWIHAEDFCRAIDFLIERDDLNGVVNLCSPNPLPNREFMRELRKAWGVGVGLPAPAWLIRIAAFFIKTDPELVLKSRRVVPTRLLEAGFEFRFPAWPEAARDLVARWRVAT